MFKCLLCVRHYSRHWKKSGGGAGNSQIFLSSWNVYSKVNKDGRSNGIRTITGEEQDPRGLNIILFSYFWLCGVCVAARELSLVVVSGGYSLVAVHEFLIEVASLVEKHRL